LPDRAEVNYVNTSLKILFDFQQLLRDVSED